MNINYGKMLESKIEEIRTAGTRPTLLLHACCAPCSSYVLEYIASLFDITLFFYNPNISPESEFKIRLAELNRFTLEAGYADIPISVPEYDSDEFFSAARGMEDLDEGGARCKICYELRLRKCAEAAARGGFDYFTTTLSISPHKNAAWLNEIGAALSVEYSIPYLHSDFKKQGGYKRSIELSSEYHLYRQNYCGCIFSKAQSEQRHKL